MGGFAGSVAAVLLAAALATLPELPAPDAAGQDVYDFFLDERAPVRVGAVLITVALLLSAGLFSSIRQRLQLHGARSPAAAMFGFSLLAIGAQAFTAATLLTLALRPEESDPATARALLDLAEIGIGISGPTFALALIACAIGVRRAPGLPARMVPFSVLTAICLLPWAGRLLTDSGALSADSFLGSTLGWLALLAWLIGTGLWLIGRRPEGADPLTG